MTTPVRVAVTGAAGQIGYSLLFRVASGSMLGPDTPVSLQLLEITPALGALEGVRMELDDGAFPLLAGVTCTDDADTAFGDADVALLVGAMPRKQGMERSDLLAANGGIFKPQGEALSRSAKREVKVLVVGNPANTNALIAQRNAADLDPRCFTAMTRLDHNRAISQLARKLDTPVTDVRRMTIWGNHSTSQYPDLFHCEVSGRNAYEAVDDHEWVDTVFIPTVAKRGAAIIEARGASSAASAASAAVDHIRSWVQGTPDGDWVSMAVPSDGSYDVTEGLISSFPVTCADGEYSIVSGLDIDDYSRTKIAASVGELADERDAVAELALIRRPAHRHLGISVQMLTRSFPRSPFGTTSQISGGQEIATRQARRIMSSTPRLRSASEMRVDASSVTRSLTVIIASASMPCTAAMV